MSLNIMNNQHNLPKITKWPFYVVDAILVISAFIVAFKGGGPLDHWQFFWCFIYISTGAVSFLAPHLLEYFAAKSVSENASSDDSTLRSELEDLKKPLENLSKLEEFTAQAINEVEEKYDNLLNEFENYKLTTIENPKQIKPHVVELIQPVVETKEIAPVEIKKTVSIVETKEIAPVQIKENKPLVEKKKKKEPVKKEISSKEIKSKSQPSPKVTVSPTPASIRRLKTVLSNRSKIKKNRIKYGRKTLKSIEAIKISPTIEKTTSTHEEAPLPTKEIKVKKKNKTAPKKASDPKDESMLSKAISSNSASNQSSAVCKLIKGGKADNDEEKKSSSQESSFINDNSLELDIPIKQPPEKNIQLKVQRIKKSPKAKDDKLTQGELSF